MIGNILRFKAVQDSAKRKDREIDLIYREI